MSIERRLVDSSKSRFTRELLRSAELDVPSEQSVMRLAITLGIGSSAVITTATTAASAGTCAAATASSTGLSSSAVAASGATAGASGASAVAAGAALGGTIAAPTLGTAVSALGMLKAMALVSLTCGALSFGGTKLALSIAETPSIRSNAAQTEIAVPAQSRPITRRITQPAAVPPPPPPPSLVIDADEESMLLERQDIPATGRASRPAAELGRTSLPRDASFDATSLNEVRLMSQQALQTTDALGSATAAFPSDDEPDRAGPGKARSASGKRAKAASVIEEDFEGEMILLQRARTAVAAGQPLVALQALEGYRSLPVRDANYAERSYLRVRALLALGQRSAAERVALPFINSAPQSPYAMRLVELLGLQRAP